MRHLLLAALLALAPAASGQKPPQKDYAALVEVGREESTGALLASSGAAAEALQKSSYSVATTKLMAFWVEARKPETGPTKVIIAGQRLTLMTPSEVPTERVYGPSDPKDPVYVGSPWTETDLRYRGANIECFGGAYYCNYVTHLEIDLPLDVIRKVLAKPSTKDIPIALTKRRKTEWRVPREELVAVLDKLGVLSEFSAQ